MTGSRSTWLAAAAGAAAAVVYTLSPLTVLTALAAPLLFWMARRGLPETERRLVFWLLGTAIALRVAAVAALFLFSEHDNQAAAILFGDEAYSLARTLRIRNLLLGVPGSKYDYLIAYDLYGRTSYLWVMTAAQVLFGPSPYGLRLLNILLFLAGVLLLVRLVRRSFGPLPALAGLVVLLFLPTLFFWSISLLKESLYLFLTAAILTATVTVARGSTWRSRAVAAVIVAIGLYALRDLRTGAVALVGTGLALGLVLHVITKTARRFVIGLAAAAAITMVLLTRPSIQERVMAGLQAAAHAHVGHVLTVGHPYKLLDEGFYVTLNLEPQVTPPEAARFVIRGIVSFITVPLPWEFATRGELALLPEHLLWYAIVLLTPIGLAAGLKRDPLATCLLIGYVLPTGIVIALTNGNVGTLIRFRGLVTPYLIWLACLGFCVIMQHLLERGRGADAEPVALSGAREHA